LSSAKVVADFTLNKQNHIDEAACSIAYDCTHTAWYEVMQFVYTFKMFFETFKLSSEIFRHAVFSDCSLHVFVYHMFLLSFHIGDSVHFYDVFFCWYRSEIGWEEAFYDVFFKDSASSAHKSHRNNQIFSIKIDFFFYSIMRQRNFS